MRCLELYYWKSLWITRLLLVINNFSSVFPTFRVGCYADKPTESAVYCIYKINLKQNILCFNFLWVTDVINDRFLDQSRSFRKPDNITVWEMLKQKLFDERMYSGFKQKQWSTSSCVFQNYCKQLSPSPAAVTFLYKMRTKKGVEFVRIGKYMSW